MNIPFTQIPDKLNYPARCKGQLSTAHSSIIEYVSLHYNGSFKQRKLVVSVMNSISYSILNGDTLSKDWPGSNPLLNVRIVEDDVCKSFLDDIYLNERTIRWDIEITSEIPKKSTDSTGASKRVDPVVAQEDFNRQLTPKEDLYIQPPVVPRFDNRTKIVSVSEGDTQLVIYPSEPVIPSKQNEISVSTDVSKMTSLDIMKLFPNHIIHTRAASMYQRYPGMDYDDNIGVIFPVDGFTKDEIVDNIIKYPHLFRINKLVDGEITNFYTTIELDGVLHKVSDIWRSLPESDVLPYNTDFIKEYVVRRYLLERDIKNINHRYEMYGGMKPFLTLFMPPNKYIDYGYKNVEEVGRGCVIARVDYKKSRNPILRRAKNV